MTSRTEERPQPFQLRLPPALREAVERSATQHSRSINAEIAARLETGFELEAEGSEAEILRSMRLVMQTAGRAARRLAVPDDPIGTTWPDDAFAYAQAVKAVVHLLEMLRPGGDPSYPGATAGPLMDRVLAELGKHLVDGMAGPPNRGPSLRESLGSLGDRLHEPRGPLATRYPAENHDG